MITGHLIAGFQSSRFSFASLQKLIVSWLLKNKVMEKKKVMCI